MVVAGASVACGGVGASVGAASLGPVLHLVALKQTQEVMSEAADQLGAADVAQEVMSGRSPSAVAGIAC